MLKPILHRIILQLDDIEEVTASGIVIPKDLIEKERKAVEIGTVVSIGETAFKDYGGSLDTIKIGDRVIIAKYSGKEIQDVDKTKFVVINDEDCLVIIKE